MADDRSATLHNLRERAIQLDTTIRRRHLRLWLRVFHCGAGCADLEELNRRNGALPPYHQSDELTFPEIGVGTLQESDVLGNQSTGTTHLFLMASTDVSRNWTELASELRPIITEENEISEMCGKLISARPEILKRLSKEHWRTGSPKTLCRLLMFEIAWLRSPEIALTAMCDGKNLYLTNDWETLCEESPREALNELGIGDFFPRHLTWSSGTPDVFHSGIDDLVGGLIALLDWLILESRPKPGYLGLIVDLESQAVRRDGLECNVTFAGAPTVWGLFIALYRAGGTSLTSAQIDNLHGEDGNARSQAKISLNKRLAPLGVAVQGQRTHHWTLSQT